ncbi:MAG: tRNA pseudouridine(55) synthase TruB [Pseudomonadota bacterium]
MNGLLVLDKPAGITSNGALQQVKRLLGVKKAGHTGSLDPAATGMLPLCFGEATKVCAFLLDADKTYRVTARLGEATDTGDADGSLVSESPVPDRSFSGWQDVISGFIGDIEQVPPMYSALKKDGKRLYELARQGQEVERAPRSVTIYDIALLEARGRRLTFRVRCSKGTYIRTLVEDIARAAGTLAYTSSLHREQVGDFESPDMMPLTAVESAADDGPEALEALLLPVDRALAGWDEACLSADEAERFLHGQTIGSAAAGGGMVRVYGPRARFLGVAERNARGGLSPRRVFHL